MGFIHNSAINLKLTTHYFIHVILYSQIKYFVFPESANAENQLRNININMLLLIEQMVTIFRRYSMLIHMLPNLAYVLTMNSSSAEEKHAGDLSTVSCRDCF